MLTSNRGVRFSANYLQMPHWKIQLSNAASNHASVCICIQSHTCHLNVIHAAFQDCLAQLEQADKTVSIIKTVMFMQMTEHFKMLKSAFRLWEGTCRSWLKLKF